MRRHSPPYYSPPRRAYGGRPRSPPRRGSGGGYGRRKEQAHGSLLVRNIPLDCRAEELRGPFERFGFVRDVYIPKDYYTGQPRGFAFVEFVDPYEAAEAQYHMNGQVIAGREVSVVLAAETRKRPEDMRRRSRLSGSTGYGGRRYGRSRSRSRSRSPQYYSSSRSRHRSRSFSPVERRKSDYSISPDRRHRDRRRSPRNHEHAQDDKGFRRSFSPGYENGADQNGSGYGRKSEYDYEEGGSRGRLSPRKASRSPSGSRSRSAGV